MRFPSHYRSPMPRFQPRLALLHHLLIVALLTQIDCVGVSTFFNHHRRNLPEPDSFSIVRSSSMLLDECLPFDALFSLSEFADVLLIWMKFTPSVVFTFHLYPCLPRPSSPTAPLLRRHQLVPTFRPSSAPTLLRSTAHQHQLYSVHQCVLRCKCSIRNHGESSFKLLSRPLVLRQCFSVHPCTPSPPILVHPSSCLVSIRLRPSTSSATSVL